MTNRIAVFKSILWTFVGLSFGAGITRMIFGLGSISNLSDSTPWGFWKGVNVIPGIALSAGMGACVGNGTDLVRFRVHHGVKGHSPEMLAHLFVHSFLSH